METQDGNDSSNSRMAVASPSLKQLNQAAQPTAAPPPHPPHSDRMILLDLRHVSQDVTIHISKAKRADAEMEQVHSVANLVITVGQAVVTILTIQKLWEEIVFTRSLRKHLASALSDLETGSKDNMNSNHKSSNSQFSAKAIEDALSSTVTKKMAEVTWDSIAGLNSVKLLLQEATVLPTLRPDLFKGVLSPPKGILLYGPPGTGKTMLAKAVAKESRANFIPVTANKLMSMWFGQSEQNVRALFDRARQQQPSVIFIDEVDSLLPKRERAGLRSLTNELLAHIDGIQSGSASRIIIVAATNFPWDLDEAALSRFAYRLYVPLPDASTRTDLIRKTMESVPSTLTDADYAALAERTANYSGRDLVAVCRAASIRPMRELWGGRLLESGTGQDLVKQQRLVELLAQALVDKGGSHSRVRGELERWRRQNDATWCNTDDVMREAEARATQLRGSDPQPMASGSGSEEGGGWGRGLRRLFSRRKPSVAPPRLDSAPTGSGSAATPQAQQETSPAAADLSPAAAPAHNETTASTVAAGESSTVGDGFAGESSTAPTTAVEEASTVAAEDTAGGMAASSNATNAEPATAEGAAAAVANPGASAAATADAAPSPSPSSSIKASSTDASAEQAIPPSADAAEVPQPSGLNPNATPFTAPAVHLHAYATTDASSRSSLDASEDTAAAVSSSAGNAGKLNDAPPTSVVEDSSKSSQSAPISAAEDGTSTDSGTAPAVDDNSKAIEATASQSSSNRHATPQAPGPANHQRQAPAASLNGTTLSTTSGSTAEPTVMQSPFAAQLPAGAAEVAPVAGQAAGSSSGGAAPPKTWKPKARGKDAVCSTVAKEQVWTLDDLMAVKGDALRPVTREDVEAAVEEIAGCEMELTSRYEEWRSQFGSELTGAKREKFNWRTAAMYT